MADSIEKAGMRIGIVCCMVSSPKNWVHESNLLLPSKLARFLADSGRAHAYLLVPDDGIIPWEPVKRITMLPLKGLFPRGVSSGIGYIASPAAIVEATHKYGFDMIISTHCRIPSILRSIFEADGVWRSKYVEVPLILWDHAPAGEDIHERKKGSGGQAAAHGQISSQYLWAASKSIAKAAVTEVQGFFGYAAADKLPGKTRIMPCVTYRDYMDSVVPDVVRKRDVFTVHIGGRWSQTKGYAQVASAVMKMKGAGADIELLNTGMPSKGNAFHKAKVETGMEVITDLTQELMWEVVKGCHVAVLSQDAQAVPCMALEQLALGLPLLVRSSSRLPDVMYKYPHVFDSEGDLIAKLTYTMSNLERVTADCQEWYEENWRTFDITNLGPEIDAISKTLTAHSVAVEFGEEEGSKNVPIVGNRGASSLFFQKSLFSRTLARREAFRIGHVENLDDPMPSFDLLSLEERGNNKKES